MTAENSSSDREFYLDAQMLRELMREARGGFAPDHVAAVLRHMPPDLVEDDAGDIAELLLELVGTARERLHDAGIEPENEETPEQQKLSKREREYAANLAALLTYVTAAQIRLDRLEEAWDTVREGVAWGRVAGDLRQQVILQIVLALVHSSRGELDREVEAFRDGVEFARLSKDPESIVLALIELCSCLVVRYRLDEAETVNNEALGLVREGDERLRLRFYAIILMNCARIAMYRTQYSESIRILREALRWADGELYPYGRASVVAHLGSLYLRLQHYQQSIECQHEVIRLAEKGGSRTVRGWGYFRLAEAHLRLGELGKTAQALDRAGEFASKGMIALRCSIMAKRAALFARQERFDEALALCHDILREIAGRDFPELEMFAEKTMADIEAGRGAYEAAEGHYRHAIEVARREFPPRAPAIEVLLADTLHRMGRDREVEELLDAIIQSDALNPDERARTIHLQAALAEKRGEFQSALNCEREAFAIEREVLERQAEQSLRNARIVAETDLLEREADLERERRRRVERELAEAIVELGDRNRLVTVVEQKLRKTLERAGTDQERSLMKALRETLAELQPQGAPLGAPLRYLGGVEEEFYRRLRERYPDLTPKQERLCGLLRAGLSSREISSVLGLGAEGLKAQRKRLRRRLGLGAEQRLETVLGDM